MLRIITLLAVALTMTACTNPNDLDEKPAYLGDFHLGHNVVVAPNLTKGPASREATKEEWATALKKAVDDRFSRYEGDRLYHLGISVEGYVLAVPGVPVVASPKSALILNVTVWDDAKQVKLNEKPEQVTVVETFSGNTWLGSGLTQSKDQQLENLSRNAAKLIQNWLVRENTENGWFETGGSSDGALETTADSLDMATSDIADPGPDAEVLPEGADDEQGGAPETPDSE